MRSFWYTTVKLYTTTFLQNHYDATHFFVRIMKCNSLFSHIKKNKRIRIFFCGYEKVTIAIHVIFAYMGCCKDNVCWDADLICKCEPVSFYCCLLQTIFNFYNFMRNCKQSSNGNNILLLSSVSYFPFDMWRTHPI